MESQGLSEELLLLSRAKGSTESQGLLIETCWSLLRRGLESSPPAGKDKKAMKAKAAV